MKIHFTVKHLIDNKSRWRNHHNRSEMDKIKLSPVLTGCKITPSKAYFVVIGVITVVRNCSTAW